MKTIKVNFTNQNKQRLTGKLELPSNQKAHNFAVFAHCFTCNKNLSAVRNISKALTSKGFGVLRFDFTGLGESEGDFEDTNFSGNVSDLIAASDFLAQEYQSPSLIIGHSLGGAAAIFAGSKVDSIKAIATIGAPSSPQHVTHLLQNGIEEIEQTGEAMINLSGRSFTIKKQFIQDIQEQKLATVIKKLHKALLVMHSPQDQTVEIKNAEEIYLAAKHPKSFITLDGADHLLMRREDSMYAGNVIASWSDRYIKTPHPVALKSNHQVVASLDEEAMYTTHIKAGNHYLVADEPNDLGGNDYGPNPYELVSSGLAACTVMTIKMYAERKKWNLKNVIVHINHDKSYKDDCDTCINDKPSKIDTFVREITIEGDLDKKQLNRIMQIADRCPVHRTLHNEVEIETKLMYPSLSH